MPKYRNKTEEYYYLQMNINNRLSKTQKQIRDQKIKRKKRIVNMADKEEVEVKTSANPINNMKDRKTSLAKLRRVDSLNLEAGRVSMTQSHT